ncbi:MAG TPA: undecaprenyl-diphosphatase UppP [Anaerolineae bacterium]|nr:undecaprenyl-diphosphatase UppP [Anaerolineae bacterium]HID85617.1 undecaprenyl-diphosphatase UppP [Anaerolineales bacterium]HIQ08604.1 undecaprenyl-diphosphatase UppP [Anaerolineaceae bacterium]
MTLFQAFVLGLVQGLTEFFPISSSGHLALVPRFLGWHFYGGNTFAFNVLVQVGTLVAVIGYFWRDLEQIAVAWLRGLWRRQPWATLEARMGWYLILATLPAVVGGLLLQHRVEAAFSNPRAVGFFLLLTALLLFSADRLGRQKRAWAQFQGKDALTMGFFQVLALFPGVSRSGSTIAGGMYRHLDRPTAARFSFLMSVPVMLGAGALALVDLFRQPQPASATLAPLMVGFLTAAVSGYLSIRWLLRYLVRHNLTVFAVYCAVLGLTALLLF